MKFSRGEIGDTEFVDVIVTPKSNHKTCCRRKPNFTKEEKKNDKI